MFSVKYAPIIEAQFVITCKLQVFSTKIIS